MKDIKSDKESKLVKAFNLLVATDLLNKEVAALMGNVDEDTPDVLPGGQRSIYGLTDAKVSLSKKKKQDREFIDMILRESVRQALIRINEIIEFHRKQIDELLEKLEREQDLLEKLDEQHQILEAELMYFQENGVFDLDENVQLNNAKARKILNAWMKKNDMLIDCNDPASYEILLKILLDIEKQRVELKKNIHDNTLQYEHHKIKLDEALQIKTDLESDDQDKQLSVLAKYDHMFRDFDGKDELKPFQKPDAKGVDKIIEDEFISTFPPIQEAFSKAVPNNGEPEKEESIKPINNQTNTLKPNG